VETVTTYILDSDAQELWYPANGRAAEYRGPVSSGIAGHVARTGEILLVRR
jgi:hypothetical protein